jgi:hypothetical protein
MAAAHNVTITDIVMHKRCIMQNFNSGGPRQSSDSWHAKAIGGC